MISIRLLGPFELAVRERPVAVTRRKERWLLAVLALEANRVVPVGRLIELLWVGEAPAAAHRMVHSHASRVKSVLSRLAAQGAAVELVSQPGGYALRIEAESVDAHRFRHLVERAAGRSGHDRAALLRSALDLWRGEFLHGFDEALRAGLGAGLQEQRLSALEDWAATELSLGRHHEVVVGLAALTGTEPVRERLAQLHMLALHQSGRTPDALALYEATRARLVEDFGVEPGQGLQDAHLAVLRDDVDRLVRPAVAGLPPAQLPRPTTKFVGRDREQATIVAALTRTDRDGGPVVVAVHGQGGAGKSALAIAAAHRVAHRFPDGQLYIDLQGGTKVLPPVAPADALGRLLRTLGVPPAKIPVGVDEAAALYRTQLARRRVLIIADNAADADQVLPLLPGSSGSAVIVTSRPVLATLDGAVQLDVGPLPPADAEALLTAASGPARPAGDAAAVAEVASACGHLPLALRIAGARMVARPDWSFADLARRLAGERNVLRELSDHDDTLTSGLRITVQGLRDSTAAVDVLAGRLFAALGVIDAPDVEPGLAAALASVTPAQAELALDRLVEARLLDGREGRYRPHDLVRQFASAQAAEMAPTAQHEILETALTWYLATAVRANKLMHGNVHARHFPDLTGTPAAELADAAAAGRWLDAERANLLAIGRQGLTAHTDARRLTGQLVVALYPSLIARSLAFHWEQLCRTVLLTVDRQEDPRTVCTAAKGLAVLYRIQLRLDEALEQLDTALGLQPALDDRLGEAGLLEIRGTIQVSRDEPAKAYADLEAALRIRRELGDHDGVGVALCNLAEAHFKFGRPERSVECLKESLRLRRQGGNLAGEAITLGNLAVVLAKAGPPHQALPWAELAVTRSRECGERVNECRARILRAQLLFPLGRPDEGLAECDRALRLAEEAGSVSDNAMVQSLLQALEDAGHREYAAQAADRFRRLGALAA